MAPKQCGHYWTRQQAWCQQEDIETELIELPLASCPLLAFKQFYTHWCENALKKHRNVKKSWATAHLFINGHLFINWLPKSQIFVIFVVSNSSSPCFLKFFFPRLDIDCFFIHVQSSPFTWAFSEEVFLFFCWTTYLWWIIKEQRRHLTQGMNQCWEHISVWCAWFEKTGQVEEN